MKLYNIFLKKGIKFVKNFRNVIIIDIVSEKFTKNWPQLLNSLIGRAKIAFLF